MLRQALYGNGNGNGNGNGMAWQSQGSRRAAFGVGAARAATAS
ncbi:hypothetical protein GLA29479_3885 [Lysobacter antibioticus]|nr:hypothetical protein GLA29479_3885 [Lysobacter antibioticus]